MAEFANQDSKSELIAQLDLARRGIHSEWNALRDAANVPAHFQQSVKDHKLAWLTGAGLTGVILARLTGRSRSKSKNASENLAGKKSPVSFLIPLLKIGATVAQPESSPAEQSKIKQERIGI
jgi:hypothetical protein